MAIWTIPHPSHDPWIKKFPFNLIFDLIVHVAGISRWQIFILVIASRCCFECNLNKNTITAEMNLKSGQKQILLKRLNTLSLWLGCLGALGISLVANFQVFRDIPMPSKNDNPVFYETNNPIHSQHNTTHSFFRGHEVYICG